MYGLFNRLHRIALALQIIVATAFAFFMSYSAVQDSKVFSKCLGDAALSLVIIAVGVRQMMIRNTQDHLFHRLEQDKWKIPIAMWLGLIVGAMWRPQDQPSTLGPQSSRVGWTLMAYPLIIMLFCGPPVLIHGQRTLDGEYEKLKHKSEQGSVVPGKQATEANAVQVGEVEKGPLE